MNEHAELFERVLAGELAWNADELVALRRASPEAARELDELLAVQGALEAREIRRERLTPTAEDRMLVARTLDEASRPARRPEATSEGPRPLAAASRRASRARLARLAAAVLLLALAGWWWSGVNGDAGDPRDGVPLGATTIIPALAPVGSVDDHFEFRIDADLSPLDTCELRVWNVGHPEDAPPVMTRDFRGTAWTPSDDEREEIPTEIHWEVVVRDVSGRIMGRTGRIAARRSAD